MRLYQCMEQTDKIYKLALALVPGVGAITARKMLAACGSPEAIFQEKPSVLKNIQGVGEKTIASLKDKHLFTRAEEEIRFMEKHRIRMIFLDEVNYPDRLIHCEDAPLVLFYKGSLPVHMPHSISVIGTREPTRRGQALTVDWIRELAANQPDLYVISGLAYGIDIAAHEAALTSGIKTIGVLGHGFHTLYPSEHRRAAEKMLEQGALVSDFFSYNIREPKNFIRRNRIIAGLTEATLVIESQLKGGAMATAEMAIGYNRDVLAVPGRPDDPRSAGCNYLIYKNLATLVSHPGDICFSLGWNQTPAELVAEEPVLPPQSCELDESQKKILGLLYRDELNINEMAVLLGHHPARLVGDLLTLEFGGYIRATPGGRYKKA